MKFSQFKECAKAYCQGEEEFKAFAVADNLQFGLEHLGKVFSRSEFKSLVAEFFKDYKPELTSVLSTSDNMLFLVYCGLIRPEFVRPAKEAKVNTEDNAPYAKAVKDLQVQNQPRTHQNQQSERMQPQQHSQHTHSLPYSQRYCLYCSASGHDMARCNLRKNDEEKRR